jgi:hypothetical protein
MKRQQNTFTLVNREIISTYQNASVASVTLGIKGDKLSDEVNRVSYTEYVSTRNSVFGRTL